METNQKEKIIKYIKKYKSITPQDAMFDLGIMRLAARISDLKDDGYNIETEMETGKNRDGEPVRYARYRLKENEA